MIETQQFSDGPWRLRVRVPDGDGPHPVMFLIHGWKGNEDVMWIFARRAPDHYLLVAPRATHEAPGGGYGWTNDQASTFSTVEAFKPAANALIDLQIRLSSSFHGHFSQIDLMGFSQGAALSYAFSLLYPERVRTIAGLAGFVPEDARKHIQEKPLFGKQIFAAHGTRDTTIPVDMMRSGVTLLQEAGAEVMYCEDDTGHKLSTNCFRALGNFYRSHL